MKEQEIKKRTGNNGLNAISVQEALGLKQSAGAGKSINECYRILSKRRIQEMMQVSLDNIAECVEKQIGEQLRLRLSHIENDTRDDEQWFSLRFRVFSEAVELMLPFSLVTTLAASVACESPEDINVAPGIEETTAVSFLMARILAEEEIFQHQHVWLESAGILQEKDNSCNEFAFLRLVVFMNEAECEAIVGISIGAARRIESYANLRAYSEQQNAILKSVKTHWALGLRLDISSGNIIKRWRPGDVVPLNSCPEFETECSGTQIVDRCQVSNRDSAAKFRFEIVLDSEPKRLKLRICK